MAISTCERVWCNANAQYTLHTVYAYYLSLVHRFHIIIIVVAIIICFWVVQQSIQHNEQLRIADCFVACECILQSKPTEQIKSKMHTQYHCNVRPNYHLHIWNWNWNWYGYGYATRFKSTMPYMHALNRWINWMIFAWFRCAHTHI